MIIKIFDWSSLKDAQDLSSMRTQFELWNKNHRTKRDEIITLQRERWKQNKL